MPSKHIVIIGGGISGLSILHFLNRKFTGVKNDVRITLLEKSDHPGGTVVTENEDGFVFEHGPNGFLDSKPATLDLVRELGIEDRLIRSGKESRIRYILHHDKLHRIPTGFREFLGFRPLSFADKMRIPLEIFIKKGSNPYETAAAFAHRRLGRGFADMLLDPMVSGIFAGDASELNLKSAFPGIYELEQTHGSLFRALFRLRSEKRKESQARGTASPAGQPGGTLTSFKNGMTDLIGAFGRRYARQILRGQDATGVFSEGAGYVVETETLKYFADAVFVCTPAHRTAALVRPVSPELNDLLSMIPYAPLAVVGLAYASADIRKPVPGFGYLIPSMEKHPVLGVLFTSQIFTGRAPEGRHLFRVMIGGARHPGLLQKTDKELIQTARNEVEKRFQINGRCLKTFFRLWPQAIPQYLPEHPSVRENIQRVCRNLPHLHLHGNFLDGISLNDSILNAHTCVEQFHFHKRGEMK